MLEYAIPVGMLIVFIILFYGIIVIHDIPYEIAVHRNHPHQDAIHVAGWISLFTIGAIWPFLWIWATLYREGRGWGMTEGNGGIGDIASLEDRLSVLEERLEQLESATDLPAASSDAPAELPAATSDAPTELPAASSDAPEAVDREPK